MIISPRNVATVATVATIVMTSAPQFVFDLLNQELLRIQRELLEKVATKYELDCSELLREFLPGIHDHEHTNMTLQDEVRITVKKTLKPRPVAGADSRCLARVWNRGRGGQCTRSRRDGCDFCTSHTSSQKHGRIDDKVPRDLFPFRATALYK